MLYNSVTSAPHGEHGHAHHGPEGGGAGGGGEGSRRYCPCCYCELFGHNGVRIHKKKFFAIEIFSDVAIDINFYMQMLYKLRPLYSLMRPAPPPCVQKRLVTIFDFIITHQCIVFADSAG